MLSKCKRYFAAFFVMLMMLQTGCGSISEVGIFSQETEDNYNVYIATERMRTLNPVLSKDAEYLLISELIYSCLFKLDDQLVPVPDLAVSYEYADDDRSVTIKLRDDVYWHDGEKFDAEDVKFTVELIRKLAQYSATPYAGYVSNIKSVTLSNDDDYTVTLNFGYDVSKGLENLTFPILPSHYYTQRASASDVINQGDDFMPVGTGMYKVESYDAYSELVLAANEDYYGEKAENSITFRIFPNEKDGLNMTEICDISLVFMDEYERETYITNKNLQITEYPSNVTEVLAFNMYGIVTGDKNVRHAIAHLVDNNVINEKIFYQNGIITDSVFYPGYLGIPEGEERYPYDDIKAKTLLARAGYVDRDSDGKLENKFNQDFSLSLLVNSDDSVKCSVAEFIKSSLADHGITVMIDYQTTENYKFKISEFNYDMYLGTCVVNERHDLRPLFKTFSNPTGYSNETVDKLITEMLGNVTTAQKSELAARIEGIVIDDLPYYPIVNKSFCVMSIPEFRGELTPTFNNPYSNSGNWYWEKTILENN